MRHLLPLFSEIQAENFDVDAARRVGTAWAESGRSLESLLEAARSLTTVLVDRALTHSDREHPDRYRHVVQNVSSTGGRVLVELTRGFHHTDAEPETVEEPTQRKQAQRILSGAATPPDGTRYAVVALATSGQDPAEVDAAFRAEGAENTLSLLAEEGGHVLLHAENEEDAVERAQRALRSLGGPVQAALVWSADRTIRASRAVADDILAEVTALGMPPGLHLIDDVLLEFAVARDPMISNVLLRVIEPLLSRPVLWETLQALLAEDGNRGKVAERLVLHRSTVDYRLQRIAQQTGHSPCTIRGLRVLATASAMYRLAEFRSRAQAA